jgi:D-alanyl-D-alanine carboxypeptidase (penicillin-binding protein 5/6)
MRKIKKTVIFLLFFCILISQVPSLTAGAEWAPPTAPGANAVYLVNSDTGTVLYSKNADQKVYPASITKLMTAILTMEKFKDKLDTVITVQKSDVTPLSGTDSSLMGAGLKVGEQITVEQLLYGLLLRSGNDAAVVLARAVGGDVATFVGMMDDEAKKLGCTNTHYVNPHGLQDPAQVTTAKDTYLIAKYAMTIPELATIVDTPRYITATNLQHYTLVNTNLMISSASYMYNKTQIVKGIKTGSTSDAGNCLVSYATYKGSTYYCVVMGVAPATPTDKTCLGAFIDTMPLYQWAFGTFGIQDLVEKGSLQAKLPIELAWNKSEIDLVASSQFNALIPTNTDPKAIKIVPNKLPKSVMAPVKKGQKLGTADINLVDKSGAVVQKLGTVDLISSESVPRSQPLYFIYLVGIFFKSVWFKILSAVLIFLLLVFFTVSYIRSRGRKLLNKRKKTYRLPR